MAKYMKEKAVYRFKFDHPNNRLWRLEDEYAYEIPEEQSFVTPRGEREFILDSEQPNHWINFTVYDRNIRVFYKRVSKVNGGEEIIYYQKDIPRKETNRFVFEFELTEVDIVAKRDGKRSRKG